MSTLTKRVISRLSAEELDLLRGLLDREKTSYDLDKGIPDIEQISDLIYKYKLSYINIDNLEKSIKNNIIKELVSKEGLDIRYHIKFLKSLKNFCMNKNEYIWIFTTNYDMLFEMAAMEAKIPIHNGFEGILNRYFDIDRIDLKHGTIVNTHRSPRFEEYKEPCIKLIKLHGSVSWIKRNGDIFEVGDYKSIESESHSMILPKREKLFAALEHPYDKLFRYSSQILGTQCKFILSCGYSLRDQHINEQLLLPKLREGKIRFTALFKEEPANVRQFCGYPSFSYLTENKLRLQNKEISEESNLWKFSEIVNLLGNKSGIEGI